MNRTNLYRLTYAAAGIFVCLTIYFIFFNYDITAAIALTAAIYVCVRISMAIQRKWWDNHFQARMVFSFRRWDESIALSSKFLDEFEKTPSIRHGVWLSYMVYTRDIAAATLNNLASAHMAIGQFQIANQNLDKALMRDPKYPMPHLNRAKILLFHNLIDAGRLEFDMARSLGFYGCTWAELSKEVEQYKNGNGA
jgi:tetratricopeptide (TPR) repeat protein